MRVVDLTLPIYDYIPVGNVWAWDVPFQTEPITTWKRNGLIVLPMKIRGARGASCRVVAVEQ